MKTDIFLDQTQIMFGNKKLIPPLVFNNEVFSFFMINFNFFNAEEFAYSMIIMDDIVILLDIDKIVERDIRMKDCF